MNPKAQKSRIEAAAANAGLSIIRWRPVILRQPDPPLLGLFCMTNSGDVPESVRESPWTEPPLIIRTSTGTVHPEYSIIKLSFGFPP